MTATGHLSADDSLLADMARAHRYDVCAMMLRRSVRRPEINVGLELVALSFAERFADAVARNDWSAFLAWVETTCSRYGDMPVISRLLCVGTSSIAKVFDEQGIAMFERRPEVALLTERIEAIVSRPRVLPVVGTDTLDEVDVVLGELIERLEAADPGTAEHSRAVSLWCTRISKRMALSPAETIFVTRWRAHPRHRQNDDPAGGLAGAAPPVGFGNEFDAPACRGRWRHRLGNTAAGAASAGGALASRTP